MKPATKYILIGSAVIVGTLGIVWGIRKYQKYQINKIDKTKEDEEQEEHIRVLEEQENTYDDGSKYYKPTNDIKYVRKYLDAWGYEGLMWGTDRKVVADKLMSLNDAKLKKLNQWYNSLKNPKFTWRLDKDKNLYQQLTHASGFKIWTNYDNILKRMLKLKLS